MSSRQEEKEQRKQERLAREAAAAKAAKRKRLLQLIGGVVVACAIIAGVVFAVGNGGGDGGGGGGENADLAEAARAAGCVYRSFPEEGREHTAEKLTVADFDTNPPTSGPHSPTPAADGIYAPDNEPAIENWVHTLEHGRIIFQYKPGTDADVVEQLTELYNEDVADSGGAYHSVLMQNNSGMKPQVAAVAWRQYMTCDELTPQAVDALREFREARVDKAPEIVP
ncbi:MAG TPA: DUF3105 domain-containing protein [Solirubrobacteraceae bacterium]|nr:DUF3105 domain-containing protein [Solirubrobacteraceae bacterium]